MKAIQNLETREGILNQIVLDILKAYQLAQIQYEVGQSDIFALAEIQVDISEAEIELLNVRTQLYVQRINLHLALGGEFGKPIKDQKALDDAVNPFIISGWFDEEDKKYNATIFDD